MARDDRRRTGPKEQAGFPIARAVSGDGSRRSDGDGIGLSPPGRTFRLAAGRARPSPASSLNCRKSSQPRGLVYRGAGFHADLQGRKGARGLAAGRGPVCFLSRSFRICTYGFRGLGPKIRQGDGKAPEGFYRVAPEQMNPASNFHLAFNLGYPNRFDRHYGRTGSALMVHGSCVSIGCYAMTDNGIEEIYALADAAFRNGQSGLPGPYLPLSDDRRQYG
jgi:hypothetical protein